MKWITRNIIVFCCLLIQLILTLLGGFYNPIYLIISIASAMPLALFIVSLDYFVDGLVKK